VRAVPSADYPQLEVSVLDGGSTDATEAAALRADAGDARCQVLRDPINRGKADQLNAGFARARHDLIREGHLGAEGILETAEGGERALFVVHRDRCVHRGRRVQGTRCVRTSMVEVM
jgi:glycosyltransferase involved in cell wall biosynthesis